MRRFLALAAFTVSLLTAADVADMSGSWVLNVTRSKWHDAAKPSSGRIVIDHHEPKLKYESTITLADGKTQTFNFDGDIDGKDHGGLTATRLSPVSMLLSKTEQGKTEEISNTVTRDGKHLIRRITTTAGEDKLVWTELYDKEDR